MSKLKGYGKNIIKKLRHIGNKNINQIFYNGNIELRKGKLEIFKDKREELLLQKKKNKEKNQNNYKNM